jgi:hypothetical protein
MNVFVLSYARPMADEPRSADKQWCGMFIGVYTSLEKVEAAISRLRLRPGYSDFPEGFRIDCLRADADYDDPMFFTLWDPAES